jgi:hypothetical protein
MYITIRIYLLGNTRLEIELRVCQRDQDPNQVGKMQACVC